MTTGFVYDDGVHRITTDLGPPSGGGPERQDQRVRQRFSSLHSSMRRTTPQRHCTASRRSPSPRQQDGFVQRIHEAQQLAAPRPAQQVAQVARSTAWAARPSAPSTASPDACSSFPVEAEVDAGVQQLRAPLGPSSAGPLVEWLASPPAARRSPAACAAPRGVPARRCGAGRRPEGVGSTSSDVRRRRRGPAWLVGVEQLQPLSNVCARSSPRPAAAPPGQAQRALRLVDAGRALLKRLDGVDQVAALYASRPGAASAPAARRPFEVRRTAQVRRSTSSSQVLTLAERARLSSAGGRSPFVLPLQQQPVRPRTARPRPRPLHDLLRAR